MKNIKSTKNSVSIVVHIILLLMLVILLQSIFSLNTIILTDITTRLESFSYSTFTKTVQNRKSNLENFMNSSWSNISNISNDISGKYLDILENNEELTEDEKVEFLSSCVEPIIDLVAKTGTTGGFIILDDGENMKYNYSSLYLKTDNYLSKNISNENFMLAKGPTEISKKYGFSLLSDWSYALELEENNIEILEIPMNATEYTQNLDYLGYWSVIQDITNSDLRILTYTVPFLDDKGEPIGIIGVEINQEYLYKFLPLDEFNDTGSYGYVLATIDENNTNTSITPIILNGYTQENLIELDKSIILEEIENLDITKYNLDVYPKIFKTSNTDICIYYENLQVYANNTPFTNSDIVLVGMVDLENMTSFTDEFWNSIISMLSISLIGGIIVSYFAGKKVADPIIKFSNAVSTNDVRQEINFPETNITELNDLAYVIKQLQQENILRTATKTDKILELLNIAVGSFEYIKGSSNVTVSEAVYKILNIEYNPSQKEEYIQIISKDIFFEKLNNLKSNPVEELKNTYAYSIEPTKIKYYTVEEYEQADAILGVIEDTTKEVEDLLVLNYERNYDLLTGIFNRRAFQQKVEEVFNNNNNNNNNIDIMKIAGFIMFDLDNLKYVNDTFGHDSGDVYIKTAANIISTSLNKYGVVGRMSGDEFYAYLYGFETEKDVLKCLDNLYKRLENEPIKMPNSKDFQIRMSGGISWYNKDSTKLEELMKYADFAMYKGKKNLKGELREFDKDLYLKESFMINGKGELNRILDNELVNFAFQPIIDVTTGEIHAYEALMRPISETLGTPDKFLQIASLEGKLWKVEKMTFFKTLYLYKQHKDLFKNSKIFINSIPTENLTDSEYLEIEDLYSDCLPYLVVEITEQEQQQEEIINKKLEKLHALGLEIALDDYGSGYANDVSLLTLKPNIVKIDRSLISNVHIDPSRQTIVNKIIIFCKENNISILGEGIETEQELEYLVNAGIDLAQGYYISRPIELPKFNNNIIKQKLSEIYNNRNR